MSSASASTSSSSKPKRRMPPKGIRLIGDFFNEVASRPLGRRVLTVPQIQVEMNQPPYTLFTTSTTIPTYVSYLTLLSSFAEYGEYTSLFDQYRIDHIDVWLEPQCPLGTTTYGPLATCVDLDDANIPASFTSVAAHPNALVGMGGAGRHHGYVPHVAVAAYSGAFTSYANQSMQWIDVASDAVQHFGFKASAMATPSAIPYILSIRAIVSFRSPGI